MRGETITKYNFYQKYRRYFLLSTRFKQNMYATYHMIVCSLTITSVHYIYTYKKILIEFKRFFTLICETSNLPLSVAVSFEKFNYVSLKESMHVNEYSILYTAMWNLHFKNGSIRAYLRMIDLVASTRHIENK